MNRLLVLGFVLCTFTFTYASEGPDFGHGILILGKVVRQYLNSQVEDVRLGDGVHLVNTKSLNDARANVDDGSVLGALENYLQHHEVRIKLPELMPGEGFGRAFKDAMDGFEGGDVGKQ